jgi:catechol 2,3-dioxygenase-like lactoylglutathione lyase family enzyme
MLRVGVPHCWGIRRAPPRPPALARRLIGPRAAAAMTDDAAERVRIGSIVLDCDDFDRMLAFWRGALRYEPREPPEEGWVVLTDPAGRGPNLSLNRSSEGHLEGYRLHLDLYTSAPEAELERLLSLGAKLRTPALPGRDFAVLEDPDGNPFCVVGKPGGSPARALAGGGDPRTPARGPSR